MTREFKAKLRIKPELWLGCVVESCEPRIGRQSMYYRIRFANFPWVLNWYRRHEPGTVLNLAVKPGIGFKPGTSQSIYYVDVRVVGGPK